MEKTKTRRVIADLPAVFHAAIKVKAANERVTVKEVMRRLLSGWLRGEIELPQK